MFNLEMKVGRKWHPVGEDIATVEEALSYCFDSTKDYRVLDAEGKVVAEQNKQAEHWQDMI